MTTTSLARAAPSGRDDRGGARVFTVILAHEARPVAVGDGSSPAIAPGGRHVPQRRTAHPEAVN
ncbi:hypothetical protein [Frankia sp. EI5c]|uniref:hypothetical protein n=1 Tax=Frankia sp. EI5c TaxID=683316 RepID=UPI0018FE612A|nr:hypothetical protein [Frankia sp. EI5c]